MRIRSIFPNTHSTTSTWLECSSCTIMKMIITHARLSSGFRKKLREHIYYVLIHILFPETSVTLLPYHVVHTVTSLLSKISGIPPGEKVHLRGCALNMLMHVEKETCEYGKRRANKKTRGMITSHPNKSQVSHSCWEIARWNAPDNINGLNNLGYFLDTRLFQLLSRIFCFIRKIHFLFFPQQRWYQVVMKVHSYL